jgi:hypothetical protein
MSNFIFNPKEQEPTEHLYCLIGQEDFLDEDGCPRLKDPNSDHVVAKSIQNKKSKNIISSQNYCTYFVRISPNLKLYNPINILSPIKDKRQYNFIDSVCKEKWMFKEVNKHTFDKYLTFLKTKNISWLKDAERELK